MAPDFDKIQAGMAKGLQKTTKVQKEEQIVNQKENGLSFRSIDRKDLGTGVAGKSSVKMDNFDTDMSRFQNNPMFAEVSNAYIDALLAKGYSLEDAVSTVYGELGVK